MFLLIDNYDSFTYNLYHFLGELGARLTVRRGSDGAGGGSGGAGGAGFRNPTISRTSSLGTGSPAGVQVARRPSHPMAGRRHLL